MADRFIDRHLERRVLQEAWASGRAELVVVHGRRRVGKSELLARFAAGKPIAYYAAAQQLERAQLDDLGVALGPLSVGFGGGPPPRLAFRDWDELLDRVATAAATRRIGLVLDEFPYLVDANASLPSLIQRWWDSTGSRSNLVLVLSGSHQAMMRRVVSADGALYGRPTRRLHLHPFDYYHAARFATRWSLEDRIRLYGIAGGVPDYLEEIDDTRTLRDELVRLAFSPDGRLFREAPDLLRSEFTEPKTYESIVRAIAGGATTPGLIAGATGLGSANRVAPYLDRLQELELVRRRTLPTEATSPRPRTSQYVLADPYLRFYFAQVDPWRSAIGVGQGAAVADALVGVPLDVFVSRTFEDVAAQYLVRLSGAGHLPPLSHVGLWWFAAGDIDAVGMAGDGLVAAASAKWTNAVVKPADLADLRRDVAAQAPASTPRLFLLGRSGFDRNLGGDADVTLVRLRDLFAADLEFER
jgi:AAA+ ATPase superfamily predicted ATPase